MAKNPNTTESGAHPGAADEPRLAAPEEKTLFQREVSADGVTRLSAGRSAGINLGMGYVDDGLDTPVSRAAETVSTSRELFLTDTDGGPGSEAATTTAESVGSGDESGEQKVRKAAKLTTDNGGK